MKTLYKGPRVLVDPKTGEKIVTQDVVKKVPKYFFRKVILVDFLASLGILGGKRTSVYLYVLKHVNAYTNKLHQSNAEIRQGMRNEGHKVSMHTIMRALSTLEHTKDSHGKYLLKRKRYGKYGKYSYLILDPNTMLYGNDDRRKSLLIQYKKADNPRNHHKKNNHQLNTLKNKQSDTKPTKQAMKKRTTNSNK